MTESEEMQPFLQILPQELREKLSRHIESSSNQEGAGEPEYRCEKCHDTGWITFRKDGYTFTRECDCVRARRAVERLERSGLKDSVREMRFSTFTQEKPWQREMLSMANDYVNALRRLFTSNPDNEKIPWLFIGGNPGSGKTHICTAVCGQMLAFGKSVLYMQWVNEARRLKSMLNDAELFDSEISPYIRCDVLYIDDLFKSVRPSRDTVLPVPSDADLRLAFEILNARYLQNRPTVVTSEWFLEDELMSVDEATFSRVFDRTGKGRFSYGIQRNRENNYRVFRKE